MTEDIETLKAEAKALAREWAEKDLRFLMALWRERAPNQGLDGGAISFEGQRAKIRDILRDLAD